MNVLLWKVEHTKRIKVGEYKTTKKPITREEAIDRMLKSEGYLKDDDGSYYTEKIETITPGETETVASYDIVLEDGQIKVVPSKGSDKEATTTGLHLEMASEDPSDRIPIRFVFEDGIGE